MRFHLLSVNWSEFLFASYGIHSCYLKEKEISYSISGSSQNFFKSHWTRFECNTFSNNTAGSSTSLAVGIVITNCLLRPPSSTDCAWCNMPDTSWRIRCLHSHICQINCPTHSHWVMLLPPTFYFWSLIWVYLLAQRKSDGCTLAASETGRSCVFCFVF